MAGKIQVIVGGQYGSEGKGHAAAELAARESEMLAIRTGGPNAGHTVWALDHNRLHGTAREFKFRQLPVAAVANRRATIAISARSLVQLDLVEQELKEAGIPGVAIDSMATILEPGHVAVEQGDEALAWGSTQKGIGAARMDRIHRTARVFRDRVQHIDGLWEANTEALAESFLNSGKTVQIEAAQGYGLGLHTSFYPKTTSADCRAIDALADVGLSPWIYPDAVLEIWVVVRPFPIRVAGDSGPLQYETTWEALGLPEERTTVTNKIRRVGGWDPVLVAGAVRANGGSSVKLWMNMADHVFPFLKGCTSLYSLSRDQSKQVAGWLDKVTAQTGATVHALGTGPDSAILF
jgi:adenylosuccinate synthase